MKRVMLFGLALVIVCSLVMAHKDAPTSSIDDNFYKVSFGLVPQQVVEGEEQVMYVKIEDELLYQPLSGFHVRFEIFESEEVESERIGIIGKGFASPPVATYLVEESSRGIYQVSHTFEKKGSYTVISKLYRGDTVVRQSSKHIHVEPEGPSVGFWIFMGATVVLGMIIGRKGDVL